MKSWFLSWLSFENMTTFISNTCMDCQRTWDLSLRDAARPICVWNTEAATKCLERAIEGNPYQSDLTEWVPWRCEVKLNK